MRDVHVKRGSACIAFLSLWLISTSAYAAAWAHKEGDSQAITTTTYFSTKEFFDVGGNRQDQLEFEKLSYDILYEYGVRDDLTLGLQPRFDQVTQVVTGNVNIENSGLASVDLLARWNFYTHDAAWYDGDNVVLSLQPKIVIPGPESRNSALPISSSQFDAEIRLLGGYSFKAINNQYHYINVETGLKKRFERPSDELFVDFTLGARFSEEWLMLGQVFYTRSFDVGNSSLSLASTRDFSLTKLQASVVKRLTDRYSVQFGVFSHVGGENSGAGDGGLISVWVDF